jgi:hypothetical protein
VTDAIDAIARENRMQFRKKPVVIEARQFNNDAASYDLLNWANHLQHAAGRDFVRWENECFKVPTLEDVMTASVGDWIICGVQGELYPCKPDIFAATYEPITALSNQGEGAGDKAVDFVAESHPDYWVFQVYCADDPRYYSLRKSDGQLLELPNKDSPFIPNPFARKPSAVAWDEGSPCMEPRPVGMVYPPKPAPRAYGYLDGSGVEWSAYDTSQLEAYARDAVASYYHIAEADRRDAERMDWLDAHYESYGFEDQHEGNRWLLEGPYMTARDALDAAIAATQEQT